MYINLGYQKCTEKRDVIFVEILVICFHVLFACSVIVAGSEQDSAGERGHWK